MRGRFYGRPGYRITGERDTPRTSAHLHLSYPSVGDAGASLTLCGWTDVAYEEEDGEIDCPRCLAIVAYCRGLRLSSSVVAANKDTT